MTFPSSPSNDDLHTEFGRTFKYSSATNSWSSATPDAPEDNTPITQGYVDVQSLPLTGVAAGSKAFVQDGNKLFIFTGSGWFEIATINTAPTITSGANATYSASPNGSPITISMSATDPEGTPITWSHAITSGSIQDTTISNDSSVFTIIPGATTTSFNVAFTASDGVNIDTSLSSFTVVVPVFQGSAAAYVAGGLQRGGGGTNTIDKFSFASDGNATNVGNLSYSSVQGSGFTDGAQYAYIAGGSSYSSPQNTTANSQIRRFSFGSNAASVNIGTLVSPTVLGYGSSDVVGGYAFNVGTSAGPVGEKQAIQKFAFGSDASINVGTSYRWHYAGTSWSTTTDGYGVGSNGPADTDAVFKYPFASGTITTAKIASLPNSKVVYQAGATSTTHGYSAGNQAVPSSRYIYKMAFSNNGMTTLTNALSSDFSSKYRWTGYSSTTNAYITGGFGSALSTHMYRYPYASETSGVSVGDLTIDKYNIPSHTQE